MDRDKKHVIPRSQYRRKRREFFHNEEREQRIKANQREKEASAERERQLAEKNKARLAENEEKARIEKLTQDDHASRDDQADYINETDTPSDQKRVPYSSINDTDEIEDTLTDSERDTDETAYQSTDQDLEAESTQDQEAEDAAEATPEETHSFSTPEDEELENEDTERPVEPEDTPYRSNEDTVDAREDADQQTFEHRDEDDAIGAAIANNKRRSTLNVDERATEPTDDALTQTRADEDAQLDTPSDQQRTPYSSIHNNKDTSAGEKAQSTKTQKSRTPLFGNHKTDKNEDRQSEFDMTDMLERVKAFFKKHWPKLVIALGVILLCLLIFLIFNNVNHNNDKPNIFSDDGDKEYTETMKNANNAVDSVVTVENNTSDNQSSAEKETQDTKEEDELGSGVVYKISGNIAYILTNEHVVGSHKKQKITYDEKDTAIGEVIGKDKNSDVAVVKVKLKSDNNVKKMPIGDSKALVLGEPIIVVGNPLGVDFKGSVSEGIVSGLDRHVPVDVDKDGQDDELIHAIQMDAPVNPGNSGGAVIDNKGKLVGIASLKIDMDNVEGIAFALPINDVMDIAKELESKGKVTYPETGVKIANVADLDDSVKSSMDIPDDVNGGVVVGEVKSDSPASKSHLQKNDVIVELDGKDIEDTLRYKQVINQHREDLNTLDMKVYRDGKLKNMKLNLK
ncbi:S1C family serine protease [Staphylococcus auricularis]|nr:trypsin-like peptidase domain-containing protein [Staphylococcus auricularis]MEB6569783.1 trypsin-like peptidase domain-containing protein [Staphylococcus auricularis]